ncbi:hypothetical protein Fcan01_05358 [Folsomia candida]|uniref:Uncharacterized protein n=1 Tax=Folsomia candida TaxID=158441 RepID=A0A226EVR4_FOLCA|nr:hypothetical protein Fcan01_05358 [Folsomia candida]
MLHKSKARGVNVIRISTSPSHPVHIIPHGHPPPPHSNLRHHHGHRYRHHHRGLLPNNLIGTFADYEDEGNIQNHLHHSSFGGLNRFRPSHGDGNFRRGVSNLLSSGRFGQSGVGDRDLEDLLQNGHLSIDSGGTRGGLLSPNNFGDLRNLLQGGGRGRFSSLGNLNAAGGDLRTRGQNIFGEGSGFNFGQSNGLFDQSGGRFGGRGGRNVAPLLQLILDKGRFWGLGTRILVRQGRIASDLFGHVIHGVSNFTERVIGNGDGDFSSGTNGGLGGGLGGGQLNFNSLLSQFQNNRPNLGNVLNQGGLGHHNGFVNVIDISTSPHDGENGDHENLLSHVHPSHHGGHRHHFHHHEGGFDDHHNHNHVGGRHLPEIENLIGPEDDHPNSGIHEGNGRHELEESQPQQEEQKDKDDDEPIPSSVNQRYYNKDNHNDVGIGSTVEERHQRNDDTTSALFRKLGIPPFIPMPDDPDPVHKNILNKKIPSQY